MPSPMQGDTMLPVNEIFPSIQGEAHFTGTPSVFIRLQGCDVGCAFCDTKHTWRLSGRVIPLHEVVEKEEDSDKYAQVREIDILDMVNRLGPNISHVVITGGEPCDQDLTELTTLLIDFGHDVQIETSGTARIRCHKDAWVTVSPKINQLGGMTVRADAMLRADEIKMPVGKERDIENLIRQLMLTPKRIDARIWLQPISESKSAIDLCYRTCMERGWDLSMQVHKYLGVR